MTDLFYWIARSSLFVGTVVLAGGLLFMVLAWPEGYKSPRMIRLLRQALLVAAIASVFLFLLHGPYVSGRGLSAVVDLALLSTVFDSRFGLLTGIRLIVLATLFWLLRFGLRKPIDDRPTVVFTVLYVIVLVATVSFGGHAGTGTTVTMIAHAIHLTAASAWLGGIVVLFRVVLPHVGPQHLVSIMSTYSLMATVSVGALVVTGSYQAFVQAGSISQMFGNQWGTLLIIKVLIVGVMLAIGFFSRRFTLQFVEVAKQMLEGADNKIQERAIRRKLRANVGREAVVGLLVLGVTAWLVSSSPPAQQSAFAIESCMHATCEHA